MVKCPECRKAAIIKKNSIWCDNCKELFSIKRKPIKIKSFSELKTVFEEKYYAK
jgi:ribosomal protein L37AE/L43A